MRDVPFEVYPCSNVDDVLRTMRDKVENILRWFSGLSKAFKKPSEYCSQRTGPASDVSAGTLAESVSEEVGVVAAARTESAVATPITPIDLTTSVAADAKIGEGGQVSNVVPIRPDQPEIERRRELVRALFNEFWSGRDDKPATFADRLNQAEGYLNDRLTACGEFWQLDTTTRRMLSLPQRSSALNTGSGAARR